VSFFGGNYSAPHFAEFVTAPSLPPTQNVTLPLLTDETLFAPRRVGPGLYILPDLLTDETIYTPVRVGAPVQIITLPLLTDEIVYSDLVVVGPQTIVLPFLSDEYIGVITVVPVALWPGSPFPQVLQEKGYQEQPPFLAARFNNEAGPASVRTIATKGVRKIKGKLILRQDGSYTEVAQLEEFFMTTLLGGSVDFRWQLSRLPYTVGRFRITKPPVYTDQGGGNFEAGLELEMLPD